MRRALLARAPRYAVVGALGIVVDFGVLVALVEVLAWPVLAANACSFGVAVIHNHTLNRFWTYRDRRSDVPWASSAPLFLAAALGGLAISEAALTLGVVAGLPYGAAKIGTLGFVFGWNFVFNTVITFRAIPASRGDELRDTEPLTGAALLVRGHSGGNGQR